MADLFHLQILIPWFLCMMLGIFVGATPGLTATMAVALIVPISFYMPPNAGLAMIIGVSFTAIFAGDIPATYLRIPGTPASAAATLDGHEMCKRGRGGLALTLDVYCSSLGGLIGVGLLMVLAPQLAAFALRFSHFEYFWMALLGLCMSAVVSQGSLLRGLFAAALGILLSTIGLDGISGAQRFTFGQIDLMDGLGFIPVMIGLFGLSEVLRNVVQGKQLNQATIPAGVTLDHKLAWTEIWRRKGTVLKSSIAGTVIGALPGAGADIAAWAAYGLAQKTSKEGKSFGTGAVEGVIAPTSANNAAVAGAWIPALVFGIPGDAVTAIVLGALIMYDIKPGPALFRDRADQVSNIFQIALWTQLFLIPCGLFGVKAFSWILRLPRGVVMTAVTVFSVVGSYTMRNSLFDVYVMFAFGLIGFFLESRKVPLAPLILGLILGPVLEETFRTGLIKSEGSFRPFLLRPICLVLWITLFAALAAPSFYSWWRRRAR
jgi:putative tricarboxylic transport membrane protein